MIAQALRAIREYGGDALDVAAHMLPFTGMYLRGDGYRKDLLRGDSDRIGNQVTFRGMTDMALIMATAVTLINGAERLRYSSLRNHDAVTIEQPALEASSPTTIEETLEKRTGATP